MKNRSEYWKKYYNVHALEHEDDFRVNDYWSEKSYRQICKNVTSLLPRNLSGKLCLDIGSGSGVISRELAASNKIISFDIAETMLRKSCLPDFLGVVGNAEELPFRENVFDVVLFVGVLTLLDDWKMAVINSLHSLKKGGLFVLYSINYDSFIRKVHRLKRECYENMSMVSIEEVETLLYALNAEKIKWLYDFYPLPLTAISGKRSIVKEAIAPSFALCCRKEMKNMPTNS